ncbi:hypothetical protein TIFTF001_034315 [Ficus carica]|uniref:Uncharacterized protein n=1 Tax=Ficus carica TaxID=3494 RepID=A0AA88J502_FICCA|nr:hypothetical protein TIFTF001_034315 [Ficus carica]
MDILTSFSRAMLLDIIDKNIGKEMGRKKRKAAEKAVPKARMSDEDRNLIQGAKINYIHVDGVMEIIWCSDFVC